MESKKATKEALIKLDEALSAIKTHKGQDRFLLEDAVVKRFEVLFEYCWKMLKTAIEFEGGDAQSPRSAIQEAVRYGWIGDADLWVLALDTRNATVHDYFSSAPNDYLDVIKNFSKETALVIERIK